MNFLVVAFVSVVLATGVFNTEPKVSEGNKKTDVIVKDTIEKKSSKEKVNLKEVAQAEAEAKAAAEAKAKAEAEAKAAAEAEEAREAEAKAVAEEINYLKIALYIVLLLAILSGALLYFKKRDKTPLESKTVPPERKEEQPVKEDIQPETKEVQPIKQEVQPEIKEEQPMDDTNKEPTNLEEINEDEKK